MYDRDFEYDYFGFKTLERSYLMRCDGDIAERPQHMIMRVAIGIHGQDVRSRRPRIAPKVGKKTTIRHLSWRRSHRDASRRKQTPTSRETAAGRPGESEAYDRLAAAAEALSLV